MKLLIRSRGFALLALLALAGCGPQLPKGVDEYRLYETISAAIGDPASCLLLADQASGRLVYRYNKPQACARQLPACDAPGSRRLQDLLDQTVKDHQVRASSCNSLADGSRGVGWAAGPVGGAGPGRTLVYAAMMEGDRAFPGRMMAERLATAFKDAGL